MGVALTNDDEGVHQPGPEVNWNESRYIDFWDAERRVGGWFRIGARPNAGYAEMSACVFLPDGRVAFAFDRSGIDGNGLTAGPQSWEVLEPWRTTEVAFRGEMSLFDDPWILTDPKRAFSSSPKLDADVTLTVTTRGLSSTMGQDQDQHRLIFLPGQADFHYQHMCHVTGTIRLGGETFSVDGRGGKDHSWGPRNWHAKIYLRWLTACIDDDNGFMLTRAVGPTAQTRSGFVLVGGEFAVVDDFTMTNHYGPAPNHELQRVDLVVHAAGLESTATATVENHLPLRHRQKREEAGEGADEQAMLRIVKQPAFWRFGDGRTAEGHLEYHDLMEDGVPAGLHE